eukprot:3131820-Pleurochrysis_carterae.AAC.1
MRALIVMCSPCLTTPNEPLPAVSIANSSASGYKKNGEELLNHEKCNDIRFNLQKMRIRWLQPHTCERNAERQGFTAVYALLRSISIS